MVALVNLILHYPPYIILSLPPAIVLIAHFILAHRLYYRNTRNITPSISEACFSLFCAQYVLRWGVSPLTFSGYGGPRVCVATPF